MKQVKTPVPARNPWITLPIRIFDPLNPDEVKIGTMGIEFEDILIEESASDKFRSAFPSNSKKSKSRDKHLL